MVPLNLSNHLDFAIKLKYLSAYNTLVYPDSSIKAELRCQLVSITKTIFCGKVLFTPKYSEILKAQTMSINHFLTYFTINGDSV